MPAANDKVRQLLKEFLIKNPKRLENALKVEQWLKSIPELVKSERDRRRKE